MKNLIVPKEAQDAEVIFVSHSGGKDSQAMLAALIRMGMKDRIVLVHADLGEMEWEEMKPWIDSISFGIPLNVVASDMDFFQMVRKYKRLPSGMQQFCTGFLKTTPIEAFIHDYMTKHGLKTAINAVGIRAEESAKRAKKEAFGISDMRKPKKFSEHMIHDWFPIFDYLTIEVFGEIANAGQEPHKIYSMGFSRLSCVFCINGRIDEHKKAAELKPELAKKFAALEREIGKTIRMKQINKIKHPRFLDEYVSLCG